MLLFMDGFDHYGTGDGSQTNMQDGVWTDGPLNEGPGVPSWGPARTGPFAMTGSVLGSRKALPATVAGAVLVGMGWAMDSLPKLDDYTYIMSFHNAGNRVIGSLQVTSTGALKLTDTNGTLLIQTAAPVLVTQNWHFIEVKFDATAGTFRADVDGTTVLNGTGLTFPAPSYDATKTVAQIQFVVSNGFYSAPQWMDDLTIRDTLGTHNNDFEGDLRVATLFPNQNGPNQGWTPQYRHKLGTGILDLTSTSAFVYSPNSTQTNLGTGDFTLEGFFRFKTLPTGGNKAQLLGKWDESNNRRSYQLYLGGPTLENGNIVFRTSTDGLAGTVVENVSYPWPGGAPDLDTWYHIALVCSSGELLLFINGNQYGVPIAFSTACYTGVEPLGIGAQVESTSSTAANTFMNGWMDELRMTIGYARYTANFTPTTIPFGRNITDDPQFNDVVLLCGFDSGINDESSYGRTMNSYYAVAATPDDGSFAFQSIYHHAPQDDTFIEAALLSASQTLTLSAQPTNTQTVTVGHYTSAGSHPAVYTFKTVLAAAFDVLIGATIADSLNNLIAAMNIGAGIGTLYGTGTIINDDVSGLGLPSPQMLVTALTAGSGGNAITCATTITGAAFGAATLQGGANIPGNSDFYFDRPPVGTTIIKAVQVVNRSFKTDAGPANLQATFIGPLGGTEVGADNTLTISPSYRWDIFETDPDTGVQITPSTIVGGRVRLDRTA